MEIMDFNNPNFNRFVHPELPDTSTPFYNRPPPFPEQSPSVLNQFPNQGTFFPGQNDQFPNPNSSITNIPENHSQLSNNRPPQSFNNPPQQSFNNPPPHMPYFSNQRQSFYNRPSYPSQFLNESKSFQNSPSSIPMQPPSFFNAQPPVSNQSQSSNQFQSFCNQRPPFSGQQQLPSENILQPNQIPLLSNPRLNNQYAFGQNLIPQDYKNLPPPPLPSALSLASSNQSSVSNSSNTPLSIFTFPPPTNLPNISSNSELTSALSSGFIPPPVFDVRDDNQKYFRKSSVVVNTTEQKVDRWLLRHRQRPHDIVRDRCKTMKKPEKSVNIGVLKYQLKKMFGTIRDLSTALEVARSNYVRVDDTKWKESVEKITTLKNSLQHSRSLLLSPETLVALTTKLKSIKSKRFAQKRRKGRAHVLAAQTSLRRAILHQSTDAWLTRRRQQETNQRLAKSRDRHSRLVLAEVKRRRSEVDQSVDVIQGLVRLRTLRKTQAEHRGHLIPESMDEAFEQETDSLLRLLLAQKERLEEEEKSLRTKLDLKEESERKIQHSFMRKMEKVLFGNPLNQVLIHQVVWYSTISIRCRELCILVCAISFDCDFLVFL